MLTLRVVEWDPFGTMRLVRRGRTGIDRQEQSEVCPTRLRPTWRLRWSREAEKGVIGI